MNIRWTVTSFLIVAASQACATADRSSDPAPAGDPTADPTGSVSQGINDCASGHDLIGAISTKFYSLGGCGNFLGAPTTSESGTPDGIGRFNHFLNTSMGSVFNPPGSGPSNGSIYYTPNFGAWSIHGAIRAKWSQLGWEASLGYPVTDEKGTPDGFGRYNHFSTIRGGSKFLAPGSTVPSNASIYFTPWGGTASVMGAIRQNWANLGWEGGVAGYPIADEYDCAFNGVSGRCSDFQYGTIFWNGSSATFLQLASRAGQTCDNATLASLQTEVTRLCKLQGKRSCSKDINAQDCPTLDINIAKAQACINARQVVIDVCFGGVGSAGHLAQIQQELNLINNCQDMKAKKGC